MESVMPRPETCDNVRDRAMRNSKKKPQSLSKRVSKAEYQEIARRQIEAQKKGETLDAEQAIADIRNEAKAARKREADAAKRASAQASSRAPLVSAVGYSTTYVDANGDVRCPHCGARNSFTVKRTGFAKAVLIPTVGVGALLAPKRLKCNGCGKILKRS